MPHSVEPLLHPFEIAALRPTQMTVGYREVARKRAEWRARTLADEPDFLGRHMIPVVLGPRGHPWLIDNHHLARALHEEGVAHVLVSIVADLSALERPAFRTFMDNRNWLHPFDAQGRRQPYGAIPKHIEDLADDPYRSLAGSCAAPAATPRTACRTRSSCGPTICGGISAPPCWSGVSTRRSPQRCSWRMHRGPRTCPAGPGARPEARRRAPSAAEVLLPCAGHSRYRGSAILLRSIR